jgi:hypothetical protein
VARKFSSCTASSVLNCVEMLSLFRLLAYQAVWTARDRQSF